MRIESNLPRQITESLCFNLNIIWQRTWKCRRCSLCEKACRRKTFTARTCTLISLEKKLIYINWFYNNQKITKRFQNVTDCTPKIFRIFIKRIRYYSSEFLNTRLTKLCCARHWIQMLLLFHLIKIQFFKLYIILRKFSALLLISTYIVRPMLI